MPFFGKLVAMSKDKQALLAGLLDRVRADVASLTRMQLDTRDAVTHGENRAEHAKDTRATEQSYLARGLAERVEDLRRTETRLAGLQLRSFCVEDCVALTAVVRIRHQQTHESLVWWLVPDAGGLEITWGNETVRTLTPGSPLGRALIGLQVSDEGTYRTPRGERRFEVLELR